MKILENNINKSEKTNFQAYIPPINAIIIAIDGPSASGKSTTARLVAKKLNYIYIDTGAMYRAVTLNWMRSGLELTEANVEKSMENCQIELIQGEEHQIVLLNGEDVSLEIRKPEVTGFVSPVSAMGFVREIMVAQQRKMGMKGGVVMDGRDIGTVVFPNAELKIFLVASVEERAERRRKELAEKGIEQSLETLIESLQNRDKYDSSREISPLTKAENAIELDTTNLSIEEQCDFVVQKAETIISRFNNSCCALQ